MGPYSSDCLDAFDLLSLDPDAVSGILEAEHGRFTAIGGVSLADMPFPAGIKKRSAYEARTRVARELYFADRLLTAFPSRSSSLPMFTFAVKNEARGRYVGMLTEDFTQGGSRLLDETRNSFGLSYRRATREDAPEGLHRDVYDALAGAVYNEAFRHMIGFVFDREVLIDFDDVAYPAREDVEAYEQLVDGMTVII